MEINEVIRTVRKHQKQEAGWVSEAEVDGSNMAVVGSLLGHRIKAAVDIEIE